MRRLKTSDFDYELPPELIAQTPLADREASRLLVLNKKTGENKHHTFREIINYLNSGDCLVVNDTKVIPARLFGFKETGAKVEILLLNEIKTEDRKSIWEALVKPGRRLKGGDKIFFKRDALTAFIGDRMNDHRQIIFESRRNVGEDILSCGVMPLPPYIKTELKEFKRYQTVYSRKEGSVAAPTAGLHFTEELLEKIKNKGVIIAKVSLKIGLDTFKPVTEERVEEHKIHSEEIEIPEDTADLINRTKKTNGKIVAVGTTVARTLESCSKDNRVFPYKGKTSLFIVPGYKFKIIDALVTNFHLPRSTLLMLVCAFGGYENVMKAYDEAIKLEYRFYSFGDSMLTV